MIEIETYKKEALKTFVFDICDATVSMEFYIMNIGSSENQKIKFLDIVISKEDKEILSGQIHIIDKILDIALIKAADTFLTKAILNNSIYKTEQYFEILPDIRFGIFSESECNYCYLYDERSSGKQLGSIQDDDELFISVSCENGLMFQQLISIAPNINNYVSSLLNLEATI